MLKQNFRLKTEKYSRNSICIADDVSPIGDSLFIEREASENAHFVGIDSRYITVKRLFSDAKREISAKTQHLLFLFPSLLFDLLGKLLLVLLHNSVLHLPEQFPRCISITLTLPNPPLEQTVQCDQPFQFQTIPLAIPYQAQDIAKDPLHPVLTNVLK